MTDSSRVTVLGKSSAIGSSMLSLGLLSLAFGLIVFIAPEFLAYLVALFFVFVGVTLLSIWWTTRK